MPGESEWMIERARADPTSGSLRKMDLTTHEWTPWNVSFHWMDWRLGFRPDRYFVSIRINANVAKAKAFTRKRR